MKFTDKDVAWLGDLLAEAADKEIMPRFRRLSAGDIRHKTPAVDLVTEADVNAERMMTSVLRDRFPGALVLGEEACSENPDLLSGLRGADLAFVIDPVDGTYNFAAGLPLFGVMLAVVVNGETVAGIIHDPVGKDWLVGTKGAGSYIRTADGADARLSVAASVPVSRMSGSIGWQYMPEPLRSLMVRNQVKYLSHFAYRCAAHEYRLLATGFAHFVVYNKLMPWDHLAGLLIHREAGGYHARFDGSAYLPGDTDGGLLVAPDREAWQELRRELWAGPPTD